jgi:hypothetical protein
MGTTTAVTFTSMIFENSVGFNRLMFGLTEYNRTKRWPSLDVLNKASESELGQIATETMKTHGISKDSLSITNIEQSLTSNGIDDTTKSKILEELNKISNKILPDFNLDLNNLLNKLFETVFSIFQPVKVTGYLDDLIGQQIALKVVSLLLICSAILGFIAYIVNIIFYINKDYLLNKFNNKYAQFYIKYQAFFARLALIYLPILVFINLFTLLYIFIFLITHPIPYEVLGVDYHVYVYNSEIIVISGETSQPKI